MYDNGTVFIRYNRGMSKTLTPVLPALPEHPEVVLYGRVSTKDKQEVENQLIALRDYCQKRSWKLTHEYIDKKSGGTADRIEFQQMLADARQRKFDLVLFWSLDRFSREGVAKTLNHLQRLTEAGVHWRSLTEEYLDSCGIFKDAVLAILATVAKQERVRRSERTSAAIERLRRQGHADRIGRKRKVLDLDKLRRMRAEGLSYRQIAAKEHVNAMTVYSRLAK